MSLLQLEDGSGGSFQVIKVGFYFLRPSISESLFLLSYEVQMGGGPLTYLRLNAEGDMALMLSQH